MKAHQEFHQKTMEYLIRQSLKLGWTTNPEFSHSNCLVCPHHESYVNNWAAEWHNYLVDGKDYLVTHWLPRVVMEQIDEAIKFYMEPRPC